MKTANNYYVTTAGDVIVMLKTVTKYSGSSKFWLRDHIFGSLGLKANEHMYEAQTTTHHHPLDGDKSLPMS